MADFVDRAQQACEETLARVLASKQLGKQEIHTGDCVDCGEEIPTARRKALPYAQRCIECQELTEQKHRLFH